MNKNIVIKANEYNKIDGKNAHHSTTKELSLGKASQPENQAMEIAATIWKETDAQTLTALAELPLHQVMDLSILVCQTLLYFQDAYRFPLLYNPENPSVERIGLQGGVLPISVCTENPNIQRDIQDFSQAINNQGELLGERLRVLSKILEEMGY